MNITTRGKGRPKQDKTRQRMSLRLSYDSMMWLNNQSKIVKKPRGRILDDIIADKIKNEQ